MGQTDVISLRRMEKLEILRIKPVYYNSIGGFSSVYLFVHAFFAAPLFGGVLIFEIYSPVLPEGIVELLLLAGLVALLVLWIRVVMEYVRVFRIGRFLKKRHYGPEFIAKGDSFLRRPLSLSHGFESKFYKSTINQRAKSRMVSEIKEEVVLGQRVVMTDIWGETTAFRLFDACSEPSGKTFYRQYFLAPALALAPIKSADRNHYHTVFEAELRGHIPHIFFASRQVKGRRFRMDFSHLHKLQPGAYVTKLFDIYTPKVYSIEALSTATPEVIEVIVSLQNCDIEFIDDRLFCYAPLLNKEQLAEFRRLCLTLHARLNDNLKLRKFKKRNNPFKQRLPDNPARFIHSIIALSFASLTLHIHASNPLSPNAEHDNRGGFRIIAHILFLIALFLVVLMLREYARNRRAANPHPGS